MNDVTFEGFKDDFGRRDASKDSLMKVDALASIKEKSDVIRSLKKGSEFGLSILGKVYTLVDAPEADKDNPRTWRFPMVQEGTGARTQWTNWQMGSLLVRENIADALESAALTWYEYYEKHDRLIETFHVTAFVPKFVDSNEEKPWLPVFCFDLLKIKDLTKGRAADKLDADVHRLLSESFSGLDEAEQNKRMGYIRIIRNRYDLSKYIYDAYLETDGTLNRAGLHAQQGQMIIDPYLESE